MSCRRDLSKDKGERSSSEKASSIFRRLDGASTASLLSALLNRYDFEYAAEGMSCRRGLPNENGEQSSGENT